MESAGKRGKSTGPESDDTEKRLSDLEVVVSSLNDSVSNATKVSEEYAETADDMRREIETVLKNLKEVTAKLDRIENSLLARNQPPAGETQ